MFLKPKDRNSHRRCSVEKGVLKIFANSTGKHLYWSVFLIMFVKSFVQKRLQHTCSLVKFSKFLRTPIWKNICKRLPLEIVI